MEETEDSLQGKSALILIVWNSLFSKLFANIIVSNFNPVEDELSDVENDILG